jgi:xanthine dehydrogenase YagS FAD-binding subunit
LITAILVPDAAFAKRSLYLKVRDRESYEFALASAAVALDLSDKIVRQARVALGGVATVPWRAGEAEAVLLGRRLDESAAREAAEAASCKHGRARRTASRSRSARRRLFAR